MVVKRHISSLIVSLVLGAMGLICFPSNAMPLPSASDEIEVIKEAIPEIKVVSGGIEVENPSDKDVTVLVYALTGQLVKQTKIESGTSRIELSAGYYIVKCASVTKRIIIKQA